MYVVLSRCVAGAFITRESTALYVGTYICIVVALCCWCLHYMGVDGSIVTYVIMYYFRVVLLVPSLHGSQRLYRHSSVVALYWWCLHYKGVDGFIGTYICSVVTLS